ncbi:MAG: hypothetical protein IPN76_03825 [Saprospiraceae bacterium]|nr:hypothetical protein [Saprospiraceae bacterium]
MNLIRHLRGPFPKTVKQLSQLLECDERTTYLFDERMAILRTALLPLPFWYSQKGSIHMKGIKNPKQYA